MRSLHDTKLCYFCAHFCFAINFCQVKKVKSIHGFQFGVHIVIESVDILAWWSAKRKRRQSEHSQDTFIRCTCSKVSGNFLYKTFYFFAFVNTVLRCPFIKVSVKFIALHYNAVNLRVAFRMVKKHHRKQNSSVRNEIKEDEHIFTRNFH